MQVQKLATNVISKLTVQQIQFSKLLQTSNIDLYGKINKEIEDNPFLEQENEENFNVSDYNNTNSFFKINKSIQKQISEINDYKLKNIIETENFRDKLKKQVSLLSIKGIDLFLCNYIIDSLDDDGYLRISLDNIYEDIKSFYNDITIDNKLLEKSLKIIQNLEPIGVGARNLREFFMIKVSKNSYYSKFDHIIFNIINLHFEDFKNKKYSKIQKNLNISTEEINRSIKYISNFCPKPINNKDLTNNFYIYPDFIITIQNNDIKIAFTKEYTPKVRLSKSYIDILNKKNKNLNIHEEKFVQKKLNSAKWFIDAINQRQKTLLKIMKCITKIQKDFFLNEFDKFLKPMILKDIAKEVNMDVSTISRVVNSKYVQTNYNIYPLKYFFSESLKNFSGDNISSKVIKQALREIIQNENKKTPYSDIQLSNALKQKGFKIARRTISKYRDQLSIPSQRLRKELI